MPRNKNSNSNNLPKKVIIALFASAYIYFFFVVSVILREATAFTRKMMLSAYYNGVDGDPDFSGPTTTTTLGETSTNIQPRAFQPQNSIPCFLEEEKSTKWWKPSFSSSSGKTTTTTNTNTEEGFFFLKTHKTGSSTAAGIHLRIARNVAARLTSSTTTTTHNQQTKPKLSFLMNNNKKQAQKQQEKMCRVQFDHSTALKMNYKDRSKQNSFLWTVIRDPTNRAISQFFHFEVSRKQIEPTTTNFIQYMESKRSRTDHFYLRTLSMEDNDDNDNDNDNLAKQVQSILNDYDFIGITERMEESVVALQLLLGLSTSDILYLPNIPVKGSGGYDAGGYQGKCTYIQPKNMTPEMLEYLKTKQWNSRVRYDRLLWEAANRSLDITIDQVLGRQRFNTALHKFQKAQHLIEKQCRLEEESEATAKGDEENVVRFPCSSSRVGKPPLKPHETDCLWKDSACGTTCLDRVADQLELWDDRDDDDVVVDDSSKEEIVSAAAAGKQQQQPKEEEEGLGRPLVQ